MPSAPACIAPGCRFSPRQKRDRLEVGVDRASHGPRNCTAAKPSSTGLSMPGVVAGTATQAVGLGSRFGVFRFLRTLREK